MALISEKDVRELRKHFEGTLTAPVTLDLFTRAGSTLWVPGRTECETCDDARQLLEEVAALSDKITLRVHDVDGTPRGEADSYDGPVPAIVLRGGGKGTVRFLGIPGGLEFGTFLRSLADVSRGATSLADATKEKLRGLASDVHIRVFVTPSCPFCPRVAQLAHQMAVESARVTAEVIEAQDFPDLARRFRVQGVPKTVVNDAVELLGAQPEAAFVANVLKAAA